MAALQNPVKRLVRRVVPAATRRMLHRRFDTLTERLEGLLRGRDPLLPPRRLMFVGGSRRDFRELGDKWLQSFIRLAALQPGERVLDVGCGVGRMAVPLAGYLAPEARYEGFDIVPEGIEWCRDAIGVRYPRFGFTHADIYNEAYNPGGALRAADYEFPYENDAFDFVFLTSVFTHMLPPDVRHYLAEIRRVLRAGGRCLATWFILDAEARERIAAGVTIPSRSFRRDLGGYWAVEGQLAEEALAYPEADIRALYGEAGLAIGEPIVYGGWSGRARPSSDHSQDIVVAWKHGGV